METSTVSSYISRRRAKDKSFDEDILPLMEKYLQPVNSLNLVVYR